MASIPAETKEKFEHQIEKKGIAIIAVDVLVMDNNGTTTMVGIYEWFIQKVDATL